VPVVMGSSLYMYLKEPTMVSSAWVAVVSSFIFGLLSLKLILDFSKKVNFSRFALIFALLCFLGAIVQFFS